MTVALVQGAARGQLGDDILVLAEARQAIEAVPGDLLHFHVEVRGEHLDVRERSVAPARHRAVEADRDQRLADRVFELPSPCWGCWRCYPWLPRQSTRL